MSGENIKLPFKIIIFNPVSKRYEERTVVEIADHNPVDGSREKDALYVYEDGSFDFKWNCEIVEHQ